MPAVSPAPADREAGRWRSPWQRRLLADRIARALTAQLPNASWWVSSACAVRLGRVRAQPAVVLSDTDPPADAVLDVPPLLVVELGGQGPALAEWRAAGVAAAWRLWLDHADVAADDAPGRMDAPGEVVAPALGLRLRWPLPAAPITLTHLMARPGRAPGTAPVR